MIIHTVSESNSVRRSNLFRLGGNYNLFPFLVLSWVLLFTVLWADDDLELIATFEGDPNCDRSYFGRKCLYLGDLNADGYDDMAIENKAGPDSSICPYVLKFFWGGPDFDTIPDMILTRERVGWFKLITFRSLVLPLAPMGM